MIRGILVLAVLLTGGLMSYREALGRSFQAYAEASPWCLDAKDGQRQPWTFNAAQRIVDYEIQQLRRERKMAVLVDVLKSRQQGISTYFCGLAQWACQTRNGCGAISLADKRDLPRQWLRRGERWHIETPGEFDPGRLDGSNAMELYFGDTGSRYWIGSAEGKTPGMGFTPAIVHASEVENWASPAKVFADLLPAVPMSNPDAMVARESTGELEGSFWHEQVLLAVSGGSQFKLVFLPWWVSPEYQDPATTLTPADYTPKERELVGIAAQWAKEHKEHARIAEFHGITPAHVAWRRFTIAALFAGDEERFACRYPATIAEAFMGAGSLAIPSSIVHHHGGQAVEPTWGRMEWADQAKSKVKVVPCEPGDPMGWRFYAPHDPETCYSIGADVASGKLSDQKDDRSERDFATIGVLDRKSKRTVALFRSRVEGDVLGREMLKAGAYFNDAWMASEVNEYGWATLLAIREYPYLMPREGPVDVSRPPEKSLNKLCWQTSPATRNLLIDTWIEACREDEHFGWANSIHCLCGELAAEERTFVVKANGRREHRAGCHDDILFGMMIANMVDRRCPFVLPQDIREAERPERDEDFDKALGVVKANPADYAGQKDPWEAGDEGLDAEDEM